MDVTATDHAHVSPGGVCERRACPDAVAVLIVVVRVLLDGAELERVDPVPRNHGGEPSISELD
jgi:hypothetical protein